MKQTNKQNISSEPILLFGLKSLLETLPQIFVQVCRFQWVMNAKAVRFAFQKI